MIREEITKLEKKYKTIYIDPPWPERGGGKIKRGADKHYPLMSINEILELKIQSLVQEDGAHLYLWVTNNFLLTGLKAMDRWGFRYVTIITWAKDKIGLGQYFRGLSEHLLFGVCGKLPYRFKENGKRAQGKTLIFSPKTKHSEKPEEFRRMIETVSYPPYLEVFGRNKCIGWDVIGNDVSEFLKNSSKTNDLGF